MPVKKFTKPNKKSNTGKNLLKKPNKIAKGKKLSNARRKVSKDTVINKKRRTLRGGIIDYISLHHVHTPKEDNKNTLLDDFVDDMYANLKSSTVGNNVKLYKSFHIGKHMFIKMSSTPTKLIIAMHEQQYDNKSSEYLHLTCFKSDAYRAYVHLTFIYDNGNKDRFYYNNDNIDSIESLIIICEEIYDALFIHKAEHLIPLHIRLAPNEYIKTQWFDEWEYFLHVFIKSLKKINETQLMFFTTENLRDELKGVTVEERIRRGQERIQREHAEQERMRMEEQERIQIEQQRILRKQQKQAEKERKEQAERELKEMKEKRNREKKERLRRLKEQQINTKDFIENISNLSITNTVKETRTTKTPKSKSPTNKSSTTRSPTATQRIQLPTRHFRNLTNTLK